MLRRLRERAGIVSDVSHYALRRSLLTAVINLGFHERIAKQIAGHEDGGDILFQHYVGEQDRAPIKRCLLAVRDWLFEAKQ
jgi:site-specific recombinase XerD